MRWDCLAAPLDGVDPALGVIDGFDDALTTGLQRPGPDQLAALTALAGAVAGSPLGGPVAEAVEKVAAGSVADDQLAALAAARTALFGAVHDALLEQVDTATGRTRAAWPDPPAAATAHSPNLLAASRSWLTDLAIAGWRGLDRDLVAGVDQTLTALLAQPRLRRLAALLDGFTAELAASCPGASLPTVPARRWGDLWSRAVLLAQPGGCPDGDPQTVPDRVSGRLLPLGVDLHEHPTVVQAQVHAVLEPADGGPPRLVRASVSAPKVATVVGVGGWQLLTPHCELLRALAAQRGVEVTGMPVTAGGDLWWDEACARPGPPADPFSTARVQLATAAGAPVPPLARHPVAIAEPVLLDGYAVLVDDDQVSFVQAGQSLPVATDRLPAAGPLTVDLVTGSTACLGLLRWDGRWAVQPLALQATVKRKVVAVHGAAWADGATDPVGKKAHAAAGDAVAVLRERAGRLLRR
jgi:hypothetical protein